MKIKYLIKNLLIIIILIFISAFVCNYLLGYYYKNVRNFDIKEKFSLIRVSPATYGTFHEELGVHYLANTGRSNIYINTKGELLDCLKDISFTNKDGFRGIDTMENIKPSNTNILTTGDSFSHFRINGLTIPDRVKKKFKNNLSIINVAGGTFGLKHMVKHLNYWTEKLKFDFALVLFIGDDITRDWWFKKIYKQNNFDRERIAKNIRCLDLDSNCGFDEKLINQNATHNLCKMNEKKRKNIINEIMTQYNLIKKSNLLTENFFYLSHIIKNKILKTDTTIPKIKKFKQHDKVFFSENIEKLSKKVDKIIFIYLPTFNEIQKNSVLLNKTQIEIINYLSNNPNVEVHFPDDFSIYNDVTNFFVSKADPHPSEELQELYSKYVYSILKTKIKID